MSADARRRRFKELVADRRSPCPVLVLGDLPKSSIAEMAEAGADVIVYYSSLSPQPPMASVARSPVSRRAATFDCSARSWRAATHRGLPTGVRRLHRARAPVPPPQD
jgi:hypothetical protein